LVAIFVVAHMGLASYADLREAHEATIRGFIKALEAKDMFTHGHTERVARFTRLIGEELGWSADRLELMRWSSLLHDVGTLAVPRDLLRTRDHLSDAEERQLIENTELVEKVLAQSDFLAPMMERAARVRVRFSQAPKDEITEDAQVLAVAKWFDYVTSGKSHSEALSQDKALSALRAESPYRYDPEVVAALASALDKAGLRYGAVELKQQLTREDISKQAMYDR
jgi:HD-GYP domain-containing protein (c-di-GMP phosphodiesterase class II)